jgi:hypothetical protein
VPEADGATKAPARAGRCANHPDVPRVADCDVCGRPLCLACAVPVRGQVVGPECIATLVHDAPSHPPDPPPRRGDGLALAGFALVLAVSVLPWSRFGDSSRLLGAWSVHWSLLSAVAAVAGLLVTLRVRRRPVEPILVATCYITLGALVVVGAMFQHHHPPLLSEATLWPWVAALGGIAAVAGGTLRAGAVASLHRDR